MPSADPVQSLKQPRLQVSCHCSNCVCTGQVLLQQMQDDFAVLVPLREVAADTKQHSPMLIASADELSCSAVADVKNQEVA